MFHGLSNDFLYSALKIESTFIDDIANEKSISGTAFFVQNRNGELCLITNRHVFDLDYKEVIKKYTRYRLEKVVISGKKPRATELIGCFQMELNPTAGVWQNNFVTLPIVA